MNDDSAWPEVTVPGSAKGREFVERQLARRRQEAVAPALPLPRRPRPAPPREHQPATLEADLPQAFVEAPQVVDVELPEPAEPPAVAAFWTERPVLTHIHDFARSRLVSPWAVFGAVTVRVVTATPPQFVLPPLVGSEASLNLFVAMVGASGAGKGAAEPAAADAIDVGHLDVATVGSGEGIAHLYAHREKAGIVRDRSAVLFTVPEVDNLVALSARQGATLLPQLRGAWSGEQLGFSYADPTKRLPIERHTYRLGLLLGVQPGRAGPLLDDTDGGTPQRFVWLPTTDPHAPDTAPSSPGRARWTLPRWTYGDTRASHGLAVLPLPEVAVRTITDNRLAQLRGDGDALDGHALLARLKVAAGLALLEQRYELNDDDWRLAGTVMAVSDSTRARVAGHLAAKTAASNRARGLAEAGRAVLVEDELRRTGVARVGRVVMRHLRRPGSDEWASRRDLARAAAGRDRDLVDDALGALVDAGQIELRNVDSKAVYRVAVGA